jgi:hypothetical protein
MAVIHDHDLLAKRTKILDEGGYIKTSQFPLDTYLDRLSGKERQGIVDITRGLLNISSRYFRKDFYLFSLLAVGTTTYDDAYWLDLEACLKDDPSKKRIIEKKGEDIDLVFCPEHCGHNLINYSIEKEYLDWFGKKFSSHESLFHERKRIKDELIRPKKENIMTCDEEFIWSKLYDIRTMLTGVAILNSWEHTLWSDGAPFGATYWEVPKKHQNEIGQKFVRVKGENWGVENFIITMLDCRPFHIYVDDRRCIAEKLRYERLINLPFTLLFSARTQNVFEDEVAKKNGTYVERPKIKPYDIAAPENRRDDLPF